MRVDEGIAFARDSRTNAGPDQVSTFSKMHTFETDSRAICLLSSGNLATTQAVGRQIRRDNERTGGKSFNVVQDMAEAAEYAGSLSRVTPASEPRHPGAGRGP